MYASLFGISGALHLDVFEQPEHQVFFSNLIETKLLFFARDLSACECFQHLHQRGMIPGCTAMGDAG
jgi:hypothetical protein